MSANSNSAHSGPYMRFLKTAYFFLNRTFPKWPIPQRDDVKFVLSNPISTLIFLFHFLTNNTDFALANANLSCKLYISAFVWNAFVQENLQKFCIFNTESEGVNLSFVLLNFKHPTPFRFFMCIHHFCTR